MWETVPVVGGMSEGNLPGCCPPGYKWPPLSSVSIINGLHCGSDLTRGEVLTQLTLTSDVMSVTPTENLLKGHFYV